MTAYEYRVIPAPKKGMKAKGVKTPEDRFALALQQLMNTMGADGWEYQRADTLPSVERAGLTGTATNWRHVLIFRRSQPREKDAAGGPGELTRGLTLTPPREPANTQDARTVPAPPVYITPADGADTVTPPEDRKTRQETPDRSDV